MSGVVTGRRRGWMLPLILVLIVGIPIIEVWILLQVGHLIGFWPTLAILLLEAALGGWLMRREGARAWTALNATFASGKMPTGELADAALVLVGGVLLMLPGFLTDVIGFVFLLPWTRPLARKVLAFLVARRLAGAPAFHPRPGGVVIEGETVTDATPPSSPLIIRGELDDPR